MKKTILLAAALLILFSLANAQDRKDTIKVKKDTMKVKTEQPVKNSAMKLQIPGSLQAEHKELHATLEKFTLLEGKTGAAARETARLLDPHFTKEEEYAMPQLGLLPALAEGKALDDTTEAIVKSEALKRDYDQMVAEHKQILASLERLDAAARDEKHPEVTRFTDALKMHAKNEEEVLYPAAILVGEYLKIRHAAVNHKMR